MQMSYMYLLPLGWFPFKHLLLIRATAMSLHINPLSKKGEPSHTRSVRLLLRTFMPTRICIGVYRIKNRISLSQLLHTIWSSETVSICFDLNQEQMLMYIHQLEVTHIPFPSGVQLEILSFSSYSLGAKENPSLFPSSL